MPPTLAELQSAFMRAVLEGDDGVLSLIPDNSRTGRDTLFGVYRDAYVLRLAGVIASDHEWLKLYLGEEAFDELARAYVAAHPSHNPNARWFSQFLPEFIDRTTPFCERKELGELAHLERALNTAFDAEDAPAIGLESLQQVPPDDWAELHFAPHPSSQRLNFTTNAFAIWSMLKSGEKTGDLTLLDEPQRFIVWREGTTPKVRLMSAEEAMMWDEAAKNVPFGALCELVAVMGEPGTAALRAAQYLQGWLTTGLLTRAAVGGVVATPAMA